MLGVVNEVPVPKVVPPVLAANQFKVAALEAPSTTVPGPHLVPAIGLVTVGVVLTVATTAVLADVQDPLVADT